MGVAVLIIQLMCVSAALVMCSIHGLRQPHRRLSAWSSTGDPSCIIVEPAPRASPGNPSPLLQLAVNPNGTVTRPSFPTTPANPDPAAAVFSADIALNPLRGTSVRVYVPQSSSSDVTLGTIVTFHGGGFVVLSTATVPYHRFCETLSANLSAVVVSVDYRLAPESRLPAAYEDATAALRWLHLQATADRSRREPVLQHADLSRWFLMGGSAGGNIVYHIDRRWFRDHIAGLIMYQPFFGAVCRTASELAGSDDPVIPLQVSDLMWELSLPTGATRDHPFSHPTKASERMARCLVTGSRDDPLIDRQRRFVRMLEHDGVELVARLDGTGPHAAELFDPNAARQLMDHVRAFISGE